MTRSEFQSAVCEIFAFFRQKPPVDSAIDMIYQKVKFIPSGKPFEEIVGSITNLDSLPRNLANAFKNGWMSWINANQECAHQQCESQKTQCGYCNNTGFLFSTNTGENPYTYVSRCPKCRNWIGDVNETFPAYTKEELCGKGFIVLK